MTDWITDTLYPNGTLKNKLHIRDAAQLQVLEYTETARRSLFILEQQPKITSIKSLSLIHKFMFGSLYEWAGQYRPGNFEKMGMNFLIILALILLKKISISC